MMKKTETPKSEPDTPGAEARQPTAPPAQSTAGPEAASTPPASREIPGPKALDELKAQAAKAAEHWDKLLRTAADFDNFKKRVARERQEAARYAYEPLLLKLVPVLDNFEAALAAANTPQDPSLQSHLAGLGMIYQQFRTALTEAGLQEIDALKRPFDPHWHEAVSQMETPDVPEGHVVQQLRKGYKLHDRLLRPATVIVAKTPAVPTTPKPA